MEPATVARRRVTGRSRRVEVQIRTRIHPALKIGRRGSDTRAITYDSELPKNVKRFLRPVAQPLLIGVFVQQHDILGQLAVSHRVATRQRLGAKRQPGLRIGDAQQVANLPGLDIIVLLLITEHGMQKRMRSDVAIVVVASVGRVVLEARPRQRSVIEAKPIRWPTIGQHAPRATLLREIALPRPTRDRHEIERARLGGKRRG